MKDPVERIIVMVHPAIYSASKWKPGFAAKHLDYIEYEEEVEGRWLEAMERTTDREVLVACSPATEELGDSIRSTMGHRGIVVQDNIINRRNLWKSLLGDEARLGLGRDLMAMFWRNGYSWDSGPMVQPVIARGWAERIRVELNERNLAFDPGSVRAEGWGESFEGCVANYTRYLGRYLGLANPIEVEFEMTVPDARFLLDAKFLERIQLPDDLRLYLWRLADGRLAGWYHRAFASIGDGSLYSIFEVGDMRVEVRGKRELYWPSRESRVTREEGRLRVPVEGDHYIIGGDVGADRFRDLLAGAEIIGGEDIC